MIKNTILSLIIGALATYLPFWQWDGAADQALGALALGVITFMALLAAEEEQKWESSKYR